MPVSLSNKIYPIVFVNYEETMSIELSYKRTILEWHVSFYFSLDDADLSSKF